MPLLLRLSIAWQDVFFNSEQIVVNNEKGMEAMKNHFYLFFI